MAGGRKWNSRDLGLKKKQLPEVTGLSSQVEDGESINHLLVNYEILYFLIRIQGRFGLCLQCALIVSVRLCFKIVVFISEKEPQSTYMEVIHLLGCVRTLSPGIYCICSILKQESLWSFWFFLKKNQWLGCEKRFSAIVEFLVGEQRAVTFFPLLAEPLIYEVCSLIFHGGPLTVLLLCYKITWKEALTFKCLGMLKMKLPGKAEGIGKIRDLLLKAEQEQTCSDLLSKRAFLKR